MPKDRCHPLHDQMERIDKKIAEDDAQVAKYKKLMFNVGLVAKKIDHLSQIIEPAIHVIEDFMGVWTAIVADLTEVQKTLSKDSAATEEGKKLTQFLIKMDVGVLMRKWEDVGTRGTFLNFPGACADIVANTDDKQPRPSEYLRSSRMASRIQKRRLLQK